MSFSRRNPKEPLIDLHIGFEAVAPFKLRRIDTANERARKAGLLNRVVET
jgi:hypothetical protein